MKNIRLQATTPIFIGVQTAEQSTTEAINKVIKPSMIRISSRLAKTLIVTNTKIKSVNYNELKEGVYVELEADLEAIFETVTSSPRETLAFIADNWVEDIKCKSGLGRTEFDVFGTQTVTILD